MTSLPPRAVLLRTWFGDDDSWRHLVSEAAIPREDDFLPDVDFVDDRTFEGVAAADLPALQASGPSVSFIADESAQTDEGQPALAVWVSPRRGDDEPERKPFRVIVSELWGVENNLNLANMEWSEFADSVDADGVFRGFKG